MDSIQQFQQFFEACVGNWTTERTYHYLSEQEVERSHTEFVIQPITSQIKAKVLSDNGYATPPLLDSLPGYHLAFETVSEKGEKAAHALNMLFVYEQPDSLILQGDYLRDRAYEEARPMIAKFCFDPQKRELLMTTTYTRVVSVDSITLINPNLRIRRILNYHRPPTGQSLQDVVLVGFGVEQKTHA
ncbi:phycobiliprotein lyase [Brasilonema sp. UFV-L1]|uniref:phycobiliprotein lyase n=1 Tax=Brasilonema sp. UFV-L1 TaxID=2234130 RepID=UPI00145EF18C|nr:phycobiliprotein lyase [Brasilonema sp. UFV-L1]NMG05916.1 phycobiliprotein lyase [Brasilonema sp. UFV-L1]